MRPKHASPRLLAIVLLVAPSACRSYEYRVPKPPDTLPAPAAPSQKLAVDDPEAPAAAAPRDSTDERGGICAIDPSACPKDGPTLIQLTGKLVGAPAARRTHLDAEIYSAQTSSPAAFAFAGGTTPTAPPKLPAPPDGAEAREMVDIEARFAVECASVSQATVKLRELVRAQDGSVALDEANTAEHVSEATFELRIPIPRFETFTKALGELGAIRAREVKARDVAKEYHDTELLLHDLEVASARYEELLKKANAVPDVLSIEHELERLRNRMDRAKGDLAWMKDRVARATVRVRLYPTGTSEEPALATSSSFYPGVRFVTLLDLRGESDRFAYAGAGLSLQFHQSVGRAIVFELDVARTALADRPPGGNYAYLGLTGIDFYSDLLGGGRRTFMNPYLGIRAGYGQTAGRGDLALGGALGLELVKTRSLLFELQLRSLALVGNDGGAHIALGPSLGASAAF